MLRSWKKELASNEPESTSQTQPTNGPTGATTPPSETTTPGNAPETSPTVGTTPNYLDKALQRGKTEKPGEYTAFKIDKRPETLELRLSPDEGEIFDYMMVRTVSYQLGGEGHKITVYTSAGRIVIKGRNLRELKDGFTRRGVSWVAEFGKNPYEPVPDDKPRIDSIDFLPLDGKKPDKKPTAAASVPANDPA